MSADSAAVLARHGRSFDLASRLLPARQRRDAAVLYHFCRVVDDLADEQQDAEALDMLERELDGHMPPRPLVAEVREMGERLGLPLDAVKELIRGVRSDLGEVAFESDRELLVYCYRVAGTVGLMMCAVLGVKDRTAWPHAVDLGVAMQLTNICRDVKEDAERGRRYLPLSRGETTTAVSELLELAERYYGSARAGMPAIPWRSRAAIAVASAVYRQIGRRLLRLGGDPLRGRTVVPLWEKLAVGAWALLRLPLARRAGHRRSLHLHLHDMPGCRTAS